MKLTFNCIFLTFFLCFAGCQTQEKKPEIEIVGVTQGTTYHVKIVQGDRAIDAEALHKLIEEKLQDIDLKLSNYRDDSEISKLNQNKTTDWLPVSPEIVDLGEIARQVHDLTHGCYDLTVKPIFDLWGFSRHENRVPSQQEIDKVLEHVGMTRLEFDTANSRIRKLDPEIQIDLSSIAQGYSVSVIAALLEKQGYQNYLVEIGGEMKVKGRNGTGNSWRIAIEKPSPFTREIEKILEIHQ